MNSGHYHPLTNDGTDAWPSLYLRRAIETHSSKLSPISDGDEGMGVKPKLCVLLTTGAMNPIHRGHTAMVTQAKFSLERHHGFTVVAGYVSPSHDSYVGPKMRLGGQTFVNAEERVAMCRLAVKEIEWLQVGTWEARQLGGWPDYPEVLDDLTKHVLDLEADVNGTQDVVVFYVCGTDHASYCGGGFRHHNKGLMVISRIGDPCHPTDVGRLIFGAGASSKDIEALSSSGVRTVCENGTISQLHGMLHDDVASQIMRRGMYNWKRKIFISASALARAWRKGESEADAECGGMTSDALTDLRTQCDAALFFFGSKRSWLFPGNEAELVESRYQGQYEPPHFPAGLAALIRVKELRTPSEVYFLKPSSLDYKGFGEGCHPPDPLAPAFHGVSAWLERHDLKPLLLTRKWWLSDKCGYTSRESRTGTTARTIVENYEIGEHDYDPCIELLYQSNPTLDPVLNP